MWIKFRDDGECRINGSWINWDWRITDDKKWRLVGI